MAVSQALRRGSSPLSRGIPAVPGPGGEDRRIIPALAGNTTPPSALPCAPPDHPRSRGEYGGLHLLRHLWVGSSPLSRGILVHHQPEDRFDGIIPALAGNTMSRSTTRRQKRDHPRSRGEYGTGFAAKQSRSGSSPLSRGILHCCIYGAVDGGIIPALAGNTRSCGRPLSSAWDHPRSRGEYVISVAVAMIDSGSSPLSRGILILRRLQHISQGIIPALAGNTLRRIIHQRERRDHPRSRGEYRLPKETPYRVGGSSPLSRGIHPSPTYRARIRRIIPALAGNTYQPPPAPQSGRDHPRSRGEYRCLLPYG